MGALAVRSKSKSKSHRRTDGAAFAAANVAVAGPRTGGPKSGQRVSGAAQPGAADVRDARSKFDQDDDTPGMAIVDAGCPTSAAAGEDDGAAVDAVAGQRRLNDRRRATLPSGAAPRQGHQEDTHRAVLLLRLQPPNFAAQVPSQRGPRFAVARIGQIHFAKTG